MLRKVLGDPTRGGVASALNQIAAASRAGVELEERLIPVPKPAADAALAALQAHPLGASAARIGRIVSRHPGMVSLSTAIGGSRIVDMLPRDQLPRIC